MNDSFWSGRKCLITGAAGFGGAHLCTSLLAMGAGVVGLDRWFPHLSFLRSNGVAAKIDLIEGDVRDQDLLRQILERFEIDLVFHLAAQPIVTISNQLPAETFAINAMGTLAVLEAIRTTGNRCGMVFASSGAYYGATSSDVPISESHPPLPASNIYAPSKVAADELVRTYARVFGTRAAVCRFMNTFGEGDTNFSRLVPRAARNLALEQPFDFGDRDDGCTKLDFLHVSDMTLAYLAVAERLDLVLGEAFNFGSGHPVSTSDIARAASFAFDGVVREPVFGGKPKMVPVIKSLDIAKAERALGWVPRLSLEVALARTMSWYRYFWSRA